MDIVFFVLELIGTAAFAITGVISAINKRLDLFGAIVLGTVTAVGGGAMRDVLLGITPPIMFRNPMLAFVAVVTSVVVFIIAYFNVSPPNTFSKKYCKTANLFDALGLGIFVVVGVNTAIGANYSHNAFLSVFVGTITGIGGGFIRDIMTCEIPVVLHKRIYAVAAIVGALMYYYMIIFGVDKTAAAVITIIFVVVLRFLASHYRWNLPRVGGG